jgi:hypothetical protein
MKPPPDGWDRDEREALEPLEDELASIRARHANDPSLDLLRAAHADALPPDLQARVSEHLTGSEWSRALVSGANDVEHSLDPAASDRLFARITKSATSRPSWFSAIRTTSRLLAAAAALIIIAAVWVSWRGPARSSPAATPAQTTVARNEPPPAPYEMPLQKPDVRLSVAALTWRGSTSGSSLVDEIAPALDAFRKSEYARAAGALESLEGTYPNAFEPSYYRALSLLLGGDANGAIPEFDKASRLADETFAADVAWYQAVAEQRAGKIAEAHQHLEPLCHTTNAHRADACAAADKLGSIR